MQIPQSEHGGIHPELAARITRSKAAMLDFDREVDAYANGLDTPTPDWQSWAFRFQAEFRAVIKLLEES